jgi:hypothetical protein
VIKSCYLTFDLLVLRFYCIAPTEIDFPVSKAANVLRGLLGATLKRKAPTAYDRLFAPKSAGGPSGLADAPRPFVFRVRHLDGRAIAAGESFYFELNLFDLRTETVECLIHSFSELARIDRVEQRSVSLSLDPHPTRVQRARVEFLTPTELKSGDRIAARPEFPILFGRIRDRLSTLGALYGSGPLPIDFTGLGERSALVQMTHCDIDAVAASRRSGRTGQTHPIGGFVGSADYEGELSEFLPYLEAARWTGVGRQTVWGKGEISVTTSPAI